MPYQKNLTPEDLIRPFIVVERPLTMEFRMALEQKMQMANDHRSVEDLIGVILDEIKADPMGMKPTSEDHVMATPLFAPDASYDFPKVYGITSPLSSDEIVADLDSLVREIRSGVGYEKARDRYCQMAIELNVKGLIAPAFRPHPKIPRVVGLRTPEHLVMQRDRVVIDCHWMYCRGHDLRTSETNWEDLTSYEGEYEAKRVAEFASIKITNAFRAESIFRFTEREQFQLLALKGDLAFEWFEFVNRQSGTGRSRIPPVIEMADRAIRRWCEVDKRVVPHRAKYLAFAQASALLGADARIGEVAELAGYILGKPALKDSTARRTLAKLNIAMEKHMPSPSSPRKGPPVAPTSQPVSSSLNSPRAAPVLG